MRIFLKKLSDFVKLQLLYKGRKSRGKTSGGRENGLEVKIWNLHKNIGPWKKKCLKYSKLIQYFYSLLVCFPQPPIFNLVESTWLVYKLSWILTLSEGNIRTHKLRAQPHRTDLKADANHKSMLLPVFLIKSL